MRHTSSERAARTIRAASSSHQPERSRIARVSEIPNFFHRF